MISRPSDASFRTKVPPVPAGAARPFWSVMIPTYNSGAYLRQTLAAVLAQDEGPERMQIVVVDDASTLDHPATVVAEIGMGRVEYVRQARNVGHIANFDTCLALARGEVVHLLHGDDLVDVGFYSALAAGFDDPAVGAAFCSARYIDGSGAETGHTDGFGMPQAGIMGDRLALAREQRVMTPSIAVRRQVYEQVGGFDKRLVCSEDWEMWVRVASRYQVWHEPKVLASYRMHGASNTGRHISSAEDMAYTRRAIDMFSHYLPAHQRAGIRHAARRRYAGTALTMARRLLDSGDTAGAKAQLAEALRFDLSPSVIGRFMALMSRAIFSPGARP